MSDQTRAVDILHHVPEEAVDQVTALYFAALEQKLRPVLGGSDQAIRFLSASLQPDRAIIAMADGQVIGVAGYQYEGRGLFEPDLIDFWRHFRLAAPLRLCGCLLLERTAKAGVLLMDGIAVSPEARGQGVGSRLLEAIQGRARDLGLARIRLDVIDTNPRARTLYERHGFVAGRKLFFGPLKWLFGFSAVTEMGKRVAE